MIIENRGASVTLVLHHPHFFDASYWSGWSDLTGCNIIAFDAPHHGDNDEDQSFRDFAVDCVATARNLLPAPIVVGGVSQGGVIAQESADQEGVIGVVGISTTRDVAPPEEVAAMNELLTAWGSDGPSDQIAEMIAHGSTNGDEPAFAKTKQAVAVFPGHRIERSIPLLLDRTPGRTLDVPSTFIHGTEDQTFSYTALVNHNVSLVPIREGSHSIALQDPDVVAGHVRDFIGSVAAKLGNPA